MPSCDFLNCVFLTQSIIKNEKRFLKYLIVRIKIYQSVQFLMAKNPQTTSLFSNQCNSFPS